MLDALEAEFSTSYVHSLPLETVTFDVSVYVCFHKHLSQTQLVDQDFSRSGCGEPPWVVVASVKKREWASRRDSG